MALEEAARAVIAEGRCEVLVVSLGADGALLATRGCVPAFSGGSGFRLSAALGQGDSMLAGMLVALAREFGSLPRRCASASRRGRPALLRPGTDLCRREDTERLYHELGPA